MSARGSILGLAVLGAGNRWVAMVSIQRKRAGWRHSPSGLCCLFYICWLISKTAKITVLFPPVRTCPTQLMNCLLIIAPHQMYFQPNVSGCIWIANFGEQQASTKLHTCRQFNVVSHIIHTIIMHVIYLIIHMHKHVSIYIDILACMQLCVQVHTCKCMCNMCMQVDIEKLLCSGSTLRTHWSNRLELSMVNGK